MPRLAIWSRDLHWHWINWTLLCNTMEVSMLRLAWLTTTQHVFQPALTGRLELVSWKIVSRGPRTKAIAVSKFSRKIVSRELGPRSYWDFAKNITFLGAQKWGPICNRDISNSAIYTTAIYREYTVSWIYIIKKELIQCPINYVTPYRHNISGMHLFENFQRTGGCHLNINITSYQYKDFHYK